MHKGRGSGRGVHTRGIIGRASAQYARGGIRSDGVLCRTALAGVVSDAAAGG